MSDLEMSALVHWAGAPRGACVRKDLHADKHRIRMGDFVVSYLAEAQHPENITCPTCKTLEREEWQKFQERFLEAHRPNP